MDVRLDVTPSWWHRYSQRDDSAALLARALELVHRTKSLVEVTSRDMAVLVTIRVAPETRGEIIEKKRRQLVEALDRLEHEAQASGELRKPTERLLLENVLLRKLVAALDAGHREGMLQVLDEINALKAVQGPFTQDVAWPGYGDDSTPITIEPGHLAQLGGQLPGDLSVVITGFEADGVGDFSNIKVSVLRGLTIQHETTLHRLLGCQTTTHPLPPIWIPPRQTYRLDLDNESQCSLVLRTFRMHGYLVEYDQQRDCR